MGDQTNENSPYPVVVGSSPITIDKKTIRIDLTSGVLTEDITASTTSQLFSLFDSGLSDTSEITWRVLNPTIAEIINTPSTTTSAGVTSNLATVKGLKEGTTVIVATD